MIKDDNYYVIQGWMINKLKLKGNELQVFAIIYGFTQDGENVYSGSYDYLSDWLGTTRRTIINVMNSLISQGLILKKQQVINNVKVNQYVTNRNLIDTILQSGGSEKFSPLVKNLHGGSEKISLGVVKNFHRGSEKFSPNNNIDNDSSINKDIDMENSSPEQPEQKESRHKYGEYKHVLLSDKQLAQLKEEFPNDWEQWIRRVDEYVEQSGKTYRNYLLVIKRWSAKDRKQPQRKVYADAQRSGGRTSTADRYKVDDVEELKRRYNIQ